MFGSLPPKKRDDIQYTQKYPEIPRNTRKYPRVKKIPENTRSYISTLLPDPNQTRYPILKNPTRWALVIISLSVSIKSIVSIVSLHSIPSINQYCYHYQQMRTFRRKTYFRDPNFLNQIISKYTAERIYLVNLAESLSLCQNPLYCFQYYEISGRNSTELGAVYDNVRL